MLNLIFFVDAEFVGDQDSRWSIMGRIIYLNDALIGWNSKAMKGVTLLSIEAGYLSMSKGLKDLNFFYVFEVSEDESQLTNACTN